jgi:hypothetical protein
LVVAIWEYRVMPLRIVTTVTLSRPPITRRPIAMSPLAFRVGDLFMSLICTCQLNGVNPFEYLTELQQHAEVLAACPERWMPWNYREALG